MNFETWMKKVNEQLHNLSGSSAYPDNNWRLWFENGIEPFDAAVKYLINEGNLAPLKL